MKQGLSQKLLILQQLSGKTQAEIARDLGVTTLSVQAWISGRSSPRKSKISRINQYLATYSIPLILVDGEGVVSTRFEIHLETIVALKQKHPDPARHILSRSDLFGELTISSAYNSNSIEGSTMTLDDTRQVIFDNVVVKKRTLNEQLEAKNHDLALRLIFEKLVSRVGLSATLICEIHKVLMAGILINAGEYRAHPVRIVGSFVPTANYQKISNLVEDLVQRYKNTKDLKEIFKFHSEFEQIHPFSDGNGRVGRLLLSFMLIHAGFAPAIVKNKNKKQYYKALSNSQLKNEDGLLFEEMSKAVLEGYKLLKD